MFPVIIHIFYISNLKFSVCSLTFNLSEGLNTNLKPTKTFGTFRLKLPQQNFTSISLSLSQFRESATAEEEKSQFSKAIMSVFTLHAEFHSSGNGSLGNTYKNLIKELSVRINKADRLSLPNNKKVLNYRWWVVSRFSNFLEYADWDANSSQQKVKTTSRIIGNRKPGDFELIMYKSDRSCGEFRKNLLKRIISARNAWWRPFSHFFYLGLPVLWEMCFFKNLSVVDDRLERKKGLR